MTKILPNLYLGALPDAAGFRGTVISVLNAWDADGHPQALWIPIFGLDPRRPLAGGRALPGNLALVAAEIDRALERGPCLVHCREGRERAPLAVAWYLVHYCRMGWEDAYATLRRLRPIVADRRAWL